MWYDSMALLYLDCPLQLMHPKGLELPWIGREESIQSFLRDDGFFRQALKMLHENKLAVDKRMSLPGVLAISGAGKTRFLVQLMKHPDIHKLANDHDVQLVPVPVTFNHNSPWEFNSECNMQFELASRMVYSRYHSTHTFAGIRRACRESALTTVDHAVEVIARDLEKQHILLLLLVDEITVLKVSNYDTSLSNFAGWCTSRYVNSHLTLLRNCLYIGWRKKDCDHCSCDCWHAPV